MTMRTFLFIKAVVVYRAARGLRVDVERGAQRRCGGRHARPGWRNHTASDLRDILQVSISLHALGGVCGGLRGGLR